MKLSNLYARLGLVKSATQTDVKNAYYKLSKLHHPDRNSGCQTSALKFREITEAYEILRNPKTRQEYDRESRIDARTKETKTYRAKPQPKYEYAREFSERDPEYEAKIKFYRQYWRQKAERPANAYRRSRTYDFDTWFDAHYGNSFESGWHDNKTGSRDEPETYETWKFAQENAAKPPRKASESSPFDFDHVYVNPIEYTIRRQKTERNYEFAAFAGIVLIVCGFMAFIIENAGIDRDELPKKNKEEKRIKKDSES